jgi:hypothetical protein
MLLRTVGVISNRRGRDAEIRLVICHSARVHGYRAAKEPYGGARGEDRTEDQQNIDDPRRRWVNGAGGLIDLVDFVALDYLY